MRATDGPAWGAWTTHFTVGLQARRRFADEFAHLTITGFDVLIVRS
jgi:hypothetical protein